MRSHKVEKAQKDIYVHGKRVEYVSQEGKRKGQKLSKTDRTLPQDEHDTILIKKGEPYYWWQFAYSPKQISKTPPKASQLTQSEFLGWLYDLQERIENISDGISIEDLESEVDEIKSEMEEKKDEQEEKRSNMPEGLQDSGSGEILQQRYDVLESAISEIESIDFSLDDEDESWKELWKSENDRESGEDDDAYQDRCDGEWDEHYRQMVGEKISELQSIDISC